MNEELIQVFDISESVKHNEIDSQQKMNILKLFEKLENEHQLEFTCCLNKTDSDYRNSPILDFNNAKDKSKLDFKKIANKLLEAECKADGTRNATIRDGLLFFKANDTSLIIMKLEKMMVIDKKTYALKSELSNEKDYFKVCKFNGDLNNIKIIDKNKTAAKYWYKKFLKLTKIENSENNTNSLILLLKKNELFTESINNKENYKEIKKRTTQYLFKNEKFDKTDFLSYLNREGLIEENHESNLFSKDAETIDSNFELSTTIINKHYKKKIQVTDNITITTKNYINDLEDELFIFNEDDNQIIINIDDKYLAQIKEQLSHE